MDLRLEVLPPFMASERTSIQCLAKATAPFADFTSHAFGSAGSDADSDGGGEGAGSNFGSGSSEHPAASSGTTTAVATHRRTTVTADLFPRPDTGKRLPTT